MATLLFGAVLALCSGNGVLAQEKRPRAQQQNEVGPQRPPSDKSAAQRPKGDGRGDQRRGIEGRPQRPPEDRPGELGADLPYRLAKEDLGPLRPGEAPELYEFARTEMPHVARLLERLREREPERARQRLEQLAPRLRHLRRVFAEHPALGRAIVDHARNLIGIERAARAAAGGELGPAQREKALEALRRRVGENLRLEASILRERVAELERLRAERVAERLTAVVAESADLSTEPPEIRGLIEAYHIAANEDARAEIGDALHEWLATEADDEINALRERMGQIRRNAAAEIDRRVRQMIARARAAAAPRPAPPTDRP